MAVRHHQHLSLLFFFFLGGVIATMNVLQLTNSTLGWPSFHAQAITRPAPTHAADDVALIRQLSDLSHKNQRDLQGCQQDLQKTRNDRDTQQSELRSCLTKPLQKPTAEKPTQPPAKPSKAGTLPR